MRTIEQIYEGHLAGGATDIEEHLPKLRSLASACDVVCEIGVFRGASTSALLAGCNGYVYSYDICKRPEVDEILVAADGRWLFREADSLNSAVPECGMLFIDGWHTGEQVTKELDLHAPRVRRWIVMHDTETFGVKGEDGSTPGLWGAAWAWLGKHPEWKMAEHFKNNNGLSVLERVA